MNDVLRSILKTNFIYKTRKFLEEWEIQKIKATLQTKYLFILNYRKDLISIIDSWGHKTLHKFNIRRIISITSQKRLRRFKKCQ